LISSGISSRQLIGRSRELQFLEDRATVLASGGGCVCVRGEAGIGKSRLIAEFAQRARALGVDVVTGLTREYANAPYAAFTEALEGLRIAAVPAPTAARDVDRSVWFGTIAQALRAAVDERPNGVVIALEDLHWADPATIDLLRFCASRLADAPILFVATYRLDEETASTSDRTLAFSAIEREADVMTLQPLPPGQVEHLIRAALETAGRDLPASVIADVRDLADGRPFFAEELLRGVFERIDRAEGATPSVPSSIRATVRERLLTLDAAGQALLLQASVLGMRFSAARLMRLSGAEPAALLATMRRARDLALVVEVANDRDDDTFAFRHALTREAVYAEMLRAESRIQHAAVAQLLVAEPEVDVAAVAEHTWRARDGENAAKWNERAAEEARAFFAFADTVRAYERAYESTTDEAHRARLAESAADAAYRLGDMWMTARWFGAAAHSYEVCGKSSRAARMSLRRARTLMECGQFEEGLREAQAIAVPPDDAAQRFEVGVAIAGFLVAQNRVDEALDRLRSLDGLAADADDPDVIARFHAVYATTSILLGHTDEARARFEQTVRAVEQLDDGDMLPRTLNNWGMLEINSGTLARAREIFDRALGIAEELRSVRFLAWLTTNAAMAALLAGDLDDSSALLDRADRLEHSIPLVRLWNVAFRVRIATLRGTDDEKLAGDAIRALEQFVAAEDTRIVEMLGGALAYRAFAFGRTTEAARDVSLASASIESSLAPFWLLNWAARVGTPDEQRRARLRLRALAARDGALAARGFVALDDARDALRRRQRDEATRLAEAAAGNFAAAGWRLDEAFALETAGRTAEALARFREIGAEGEVRRLTDVAAQVRRRGDATLTAREREIATLLLAGRTARAIGEALVISERTVETHVAAIYRKLGVTTRAELSALLERPGASP
jgi:DNA-binding CsgD family transcriptional regulator/tetratricopeptide (TPR) repeat protein